MKLKRLLYVLVGVLVLPIYLILKKLLYRLKKHVEGNEEYNQLKKFHELTDLVANKYKNNDFDNIDKIASKLILLSEDFNDNWDYGNALHWSYIVKGYLAAKNENFSEAKKYLLKSTEIKISPQMLFAGGVDMKLCEHLENKIGLCDQTKGYRMWVGEL